MSVSMGRKEKTMPTNEERREIAAKLRESREFISSMPKITLEQNTFDAFERILACIEYERGNIFDYLADLIEPEPERTCHFRNDGHGIIWCDAQECAHDMDEYFPIPNYCPSCGAKVVS